MAISSSLERVNTTRASGSILTGAHRQVIQSVGASRTLLPAESGSLCMFDVATGLVYTLPAAVEGMTFEFGYSVSRTSTNAYKIITATGDFLLGAYFALDPTIATSGDVFTGDGSTHVALTLDADTEGGIIGGLIRVVAISATQWYITGHVVGTGTMTTGFATS